MTSSLSAPDKEVGIESETAAYVCASYLASTEYLQ